MYVEILKEMFAEMVEKKNASLIPKYYHEGFELSANGQTQDYAYFLEFHQQVYQTGIQYKVSYDEQAFVEAGNKVAARVFFVITKPGEPVKELEVILVAEFKGHQVFRVWELCYPDWTKMPEFQTHQ